MSWDIAYSWTPATSHTTARIRRFMASNCAAPKWSIFQWFPLPRLISRACKTSQSLCLPVRFISSHFPRVAADLVTSISPASYWTTFKKRCVYFYFMSMSVLSACALCMPSAQGGQKKSVFSLCLKLEATKVSAGHGAVVLCKSRDLTTEQSLQSQKLILKKIK